MRIVAQETRLWRFQQRAQIRECGFVGQRAIKPIVVQIVVAERGEEFVNAIARKFIDEGVVRPVFRFAIDDERDNSGDDFSGGDDSSDDGGGDDGGSSDS